MTWTPRRRAIFLPLAFGFAACGSDGTGPHFDDLVITTASLEAATQHQPYTASINAEGGDGDYQWNVQSGSLPDGLTFSVEDLPDNDALVTGTPVRVGTSSFTVQVQSGDGQSAVVDLTLEVLSAPGPLTILNVFLPPAVVGASYDVRLRASGTTAQTYDWSLVSGSLPAGLSLNGADIEGTPTATGQSTITVEVSAAGEAKQATFTLRVVPNRTGSYDITTVEVAPIPASIRPSFDDAIAAWKATVVGDLQGSLIGQSFFGSGSCGGYGESVNGTAVEDILIIVEIAPIDGPGEVLGQAGPCAIRGEGGGQLPIVGLLTLDSEDLETLTAPGSGDTMMFIIFHEIGHVLGFGALWETLNLVTGAGTANPRFTGPLAVQEWQALGGSGDVAVENTGGEGTADVHWDENAFGNERMTGFTEAPGVDQPFSRVSIASMEDMGYSVDYSVADAYALPSLLGHGVFRPELGYDKVLSGPILVARPDGTSYPLQR